METLPRWLPHDFTVASRAEHDNPFDVAFGASVVSPSTSVYDVDGYHDGDGIWKLRVAPWEEGTWSLVTHSDEPALDGVELLFECAPETHPQVHGGLCVDARQPHHFVWEDGESYFLLGYECDWLWALDLTSTGTVDAGIPTIERLLDRLAGHGYNHVLLNAYAHDCGWQEGATGPDDYGPPPLYAWGGTNDAPDHSRFNLAYWRHYDRVIDALMRRGMVAHVMIKVYNKMVNWPALGSPDDDRYFRWLIARYAAFPNVVWDFSKESNNEPDLAYKLDRMRLIRRHDPYRRLLTTHDDEAVYDTGAYDAVLDFHSDQHHQDWHAETLRKRALSRWPVVNVELGYEHGPGGPSDRTYGVTQSPEEQCRRAWEVCMAGGYAAYYYTYTAWDVVRPDDEPPGYRYFANLAAFFSSTGYRQMRPADELARVVGDGKHETAIYCLANPGEEYIVFTNRPAAFEISLDGTEQYAGRWYDPFAGEWLDAGAHEPGTLRVDPPEHAPAQPIVLHLQRESPES